MKTKDSLTLSTKICRRCRGHADDPALVRKKKPAGEDRRTSRLTITLCRACHDAASALYATQLAAPHAALRYTRVPRTHPEYDDFAAELSMIAWRCCVDFDESRGLKLSTYVLNSLRFAARTCLRRYNQRGLSSTNGETFSGFASLDAELGDDGELSISQMIGVESDASERIEDNERVNRIRRVLTKLHRRDRFIVEARYLEPTPWSLEDVGKAIGVSKERVRQIEVRALAELKKRLTEEGITSDEN